MRKGGRYNTTGLVEDRFEPGSRGRVLQNKQGITGKRAMDELEAREQLRALTAFLDLYDREHRFTAADICRMHEAWLGNVYEWAGKYRQVNISKGDFTFAMARQVPALMGKLEQGRCATSRSACQQCRKMSFMLSPSSTPNWSHQSFSGRKRPTGPC